MAFEQWAETAIEVVLLTPAASSENPETAAAESLDLSSSRSARLILGLREQGLEPSLITQVGEADPATLRARLAALLAGPEDATAPLPPIALLSADVVVNAPALGAVLDDPRTVRLSARGRSWRLKGWSPGHVTVDRHAV